MVVDKKVHKVQPTTGQGDAQIAKDSADLGAAAKRDANSVVKDTAKLDPKSSPATKEGAKEIKKQTHESIMEENRKIVDDVLAGR
jgi:hypothetical protein